MRVFMVPNSKIGRLKTEKIIGRVVIVIFSIMFAENEHSILINKEHKRALENAIFLCFSERFQILELCILHKIPICFSIRNLSLKDLKECFIFCIIREGKYVRRT